MIKLLKIIIPTLIWEKLIEFIFNLSDLYAHKSYSQEGGDMILKRIFEYYQFELERKR